MTAELNELFEEATTRSRELADAADEAMTTIDGLVEKAEGLSQRVQDEGSEACGHLRDLAQRMEEAEGELETSRGQAESALEALAGKATDLKTEVGELLEQVKKDMAELEAHQDRLDDSLDTQTSSAQADLTELARKTQEAQAEAGRHLQEAGDALDAFRSALSAARDEFAQKYQALGTALEALETHAHEQVQAGYEAMDALLADQAKAMTETANTMVDRHNQTMQHLKQRFVLDAPQKLAAALAPLESALEQLGTTAAGRQQTLSARAQELAQAASLAVPTVEQIRAVLESTARLR
jgi:DNA repair exonuclease SbcCD ATPase subunit